MAPGNTPGGGWISRLSWPAPPIDVHPGGMTDSPRCRWCEGTLDPEAVFWSLARDPVAGGEIVLTACSPEHLQALHEGIHTEPETP